MEEVVDFFKRLFDMDSWPPRWHCGEWTEFHGWLYIISDLAIWAAYFTIPFLLIHFILRKKNVPFPKIFWLFGTFILACGATHFIDALIFWLPVYRVSALVRFITALASWGTIYALYRVLPHAFSLKTPGELERVVNERTEELHLSMKKMRFLADAMPQLVWTAKPDGSIDYFNLTALKYTGKSLDLLSDWKWADIIHPSDKEKNMKKWEESINNGSDFYMESRLRNSTGEYHWHLTRAHAQKDEGGNVLMWVGTATNIEHQKRQAAELEQTVELRTKELKKANEELLRSNESLDRFAAIASHDLQAPLRTVSSYLDILKEEETLTERSKGFIDRTTAATSRMSKLIQNLLDYARINSLEVKVEKVDLNKVMEDVIANLDAVIKSKGAEITFADLPVITADRQQMVQLFQNLISNGIKYNQNVKPWVSITSAFRENSHEFSITDNGVGIRQEDLQKAFEVFTRLQPEEGGTGLGLTICKTIVERHKGKLNVESEIGRGTTFRFTIPADLSELKPFPGSGK